MPGVNAPLPVALVHSAPSDYGASPYFEVRTRGDRRIRIIFHDDTGFPFTHTKEKILDALDQDLLLRLIIVSDQPTRDFSDVLPGHDRLLLCAENGTKILHNGTTIDIVNPSVETGLFECFKALGTPITQEQAKYLSYVQPTKVAPAQPLPDGVPADADLSIQDRIPTKCLRIQYPGDEPVRVFFYLIPTLDLPALPQDEIDYIGRLCEQSAVVFQSPAPLAQLIGLNLPHPVVLHSTNDRKVAFPNRNPDLNIEEWQYPQDAQISYAATDEDVSLAGVHLPGQPLFTAPRIAAFRAILNHDHLAIPIRTTPEDAAILASVQYEFC